MLTFTTKLLRESALFDRHFFSRISLHLGEFVSLFLENRCSTVSLYNLMMSGIAAISNPSSSNRSTLVPPQQMETDGNRCKIDDSNCTNCKEALNKVWEVTIKYSSLLQKFEHDFNNNTVTGRKRYLTKYHFSWFLTSSRKSIFSLVGFRKSWQNWISITRPCNMSQTVLHTQTLKQISSRASFLCEHKTKDHRLPLTNTELVSQQSSRCQNPRQVWSICTWKKLYSGSTSVYPGPHFL